MPCFTPKERLDQETGPVERVRLDKETLTDEVTIDEEVRKERIETDGAEYPRRREAVGAHQCPG